MGMDIQHPLLRLQLLPGIAVGRFRKGLTLGIGACFLAAGIHLVGAEGNQLGPHFLGSLGQGHRKNHIGPVGAFRVMFTGSDVGDRRSVQNQFRAVPPDKGPQLFARVTQQGAVHPDGGGIALHGPSSQKAMRPGNQNTGGIFHFGQLLCIRSWIFPVEIRR